MVRLNEIFRLSEVDWSKFPMSSDPPHVLDPQYRQKTAARKKALGGQPQAQQAQQTITAKDVKFQDILNDPVAGKNVHRDELDEPDRLDWVLFSDGISIGMPSRGGTNVITHPEHGMLFQELGWETRDEKSPLSDDEIDDILGRVER